jgi:hypothetical protein
MFAQIPYLISLGRIKGSIRKRHNKTGHCLPEQERYVFCGVSWASSGGCAQRPMSPPVGAIIILFFMFFFQGAVFGLGVIFVPGNKCQHSEHVARMPCSSWPRKELLCSISITLRTALPVLGPLIFPAYLIVVALACPRRNRQASLACHSLRENEL